MDKKYVRIGEAFLIGGAVGAATGILFAPKPGKEIRADIKEKKDEVWEEGKELYSDAMNKAETVGKEAQRQFTEAWYKTREILSKTVGRAFCAGCEQLS